MAQPIAPKEDVLANLGTEEFKKILPLLAAAIRNPAAYAGIDHEALVRNGVFDHIRENGEGLLTIVTAAGDTFYVQIASIKFISNYDGTNQEHASYLPEDFKAYEDGEEESQGISLGIGPVRTIRLPE